MLSKALLCRACVLPAQIRSQVREGYTTVDLMRWPRPHMDRYEALDELLQVAQIACPIYLHHIQFATRRWLILSRCGYGCETTRQHPDMSPELSDKMRRTLNEIKAFEHSEEVRLHRQMAEQDTLTTGREQGELREKLDKALADLRYCQGQLEKAEVRLPRPSVGACRM